LEVEDGEFMVLVGPSGCGKTTALRMVAGLEDASAGMIRIAGQLVNNLAPRHRDVAMVFQNYALYPQMSVAENIGFALKVRKESKSEIDRKVGEAAALLGLGDCLALKPAQLSGGMRQRVAMGRALVREPTVFLMDEPLSNLDAKLRVQMRAEVSRIQRRLAVATLYVTHDQIEAMTMGDRIAVLRGGVLQQCDKPQAVYNQPLNMFVAAFIGSPAMNLYEAELGRGASSLTLGSQQIALPESVLRGRPGLAAFAGSKVVAGLRPEHLTIALKGDVDTLLQGDVDLVESVGSELLVHFRIDARRVTADGANPAEEEGLVVSGEGVARLDPMTEIRLGQRVPFAVAVERMHFFNLKTGTAIW
jgi:multiple sugar transport system ATP-binding protein